MSPLSAPRRWVVAVNLLSGARLALAAVFPLIRPSWWPAVIVAAAASDLADGLIARRFGASTWLGGLLDAGADKAFTLSVVVTFTVVGRLAVWQLPLLLVRDLAVGVVLAWVAASRRWEALKRMPARPLGKLTTAANFLFVLALAALPAWRTLTLTLFIVAAALSVLAGADYLLRFVRGYRRWVSRTG